VRESTGERVRDVSREPPRDVPPAVPRPGVPRRFPDLDEPREPAEPLERAPLERGPVEPYDRGDARRAEETEAPPGWGIELPTMVRIRGLPSAIGCLKRLFILAVIAAILFAMASAWFFSSVLVGDRDRVRTREHGARLARASPRSSPGVVVPIGESGEVRVVRTAAVFVELA